MPEEPETLGERLKRLENSVWRLKCDVEQARTSEALFEDMFEHILMPAILLLAGHGHREQLAGMVLRASEAHATHKNLEASMQQAGVDLLDGWRKWIEALPEYRVPHYPDRHPEIFE